MAMLELTYYPSQNWIITPAALSLTEARPQTANDQKWQLVLSGIASTQYTTKGSAFEHTPPIQSLRFVPDFKAPCNYAISKHGLRKPTGTEGLTYNLGFQVEQWSAFVSFASMTNTNANVGLFAMRKWRTSPYKNGTDVFSQRSVPQIFDGIVADYSVADQNTAWYGVSYNVTLLGRIVFTHVIIT
jgi:hypothetical protein